VHGSEDNIPIEGCREWRDVLANARLFRMSGVGHYPFYERPDQFFDAVGVFLDGGWPEGAEPRAVATPV